MKTQNKKCAIEAATSVGANETNQVNSTVDYGNCQESAVPKIKELVGLLGRMEELREELDILSVRGDCHSVEVHVSSDSFPDLFSFGEYDTKRFAEYGSDEYRTVVGGVKFFCLVDKEVQDESL